MHSWIGQELEDPDGGGNTHPYTWLELVASALDSYFTQMQGALQDTSITPNLILCIDSLTLKLEGIFRDLSKLSAMNTVKHKGGSLREVLIDELLAIKELNKIFTDDQIYFFKFLLTSHGFNYRNSVAHSFLKPRDYGFHKAHLLILALLTMARFKIKVRHSDVTS
jgi:hypothetical protein